MNNHSNIDFPRSSFSGIPFPVFTSTLIFLPKYLQIKKVFLTKNNAVKDNGHFRYHLTTSTLIQG